MDLNKIYYGDYLQLIKRLPSKSIDFIFTDPPYGLTNAPWDTPINLGEMWVEFKRVLKPNGLSAIFATTPFDKVLGVSNIKQLKYEWIWEKTQATGHLNAKRQPMKAHENILIFYDKPPVYYPQKTDGHVRKVSTAVHKRNTSTGELYGKSDNFADYDSTERYPRSVLKYKSDKQTCYKFSTQKPIALVEYLIKTYTTEGQVILDCFSGSGSISLGAKNLDREFIAFENNEQNYGISCERLGQNIHI